MCSDTHYICRMIAHIRHKGLKLYYEEGKGSKLPAAQLSKIRRIIDILDAISTEDDIKAMGSGIHMLKGDYAGFWSIHVTGNYRIIFRFKAGDIYDVDYIDYH
jgi:proteic killer suppression protein